MAVPLASLLVVLKVNEFNGFSENIESVLLDNRDLVSFEVKLL